MVSRKNLGRTLLALQNTFPSRGTDPSWGMPLTLSTRIRIRFPSERDIRSKMILEKNKNTKMKDLGCSKASNSIGAGVNMYAPGISKCS